MVVWEDVLSAEKKKPYFTDLIKWVKDERKSGKEIYPPAKDVFNAFNYTEFSEIKIVILGQDPYHEVNQAHGLAFSVKEGVAFPPSLSNIFKELEREYKESLTPFYLPRSGSLEKWAKQGVFLLNTVLTVEKGKANSHANKGWETFTDNVIKTINDKREGVIFMLWGASAIKKSIYIDSTKHYILKSPHPSPLSAHRGFIGCNHFIEANKILEKGDFEKIDWRLQ